MLVTLSVAREYNLQMSWLRCVPQFVVGCEFGEILVSLLVCFYFHPLIEQN